MKVEFKNPLDVKVKVELERSVTSAYINEAGHLIFVMVDGAEQDIGHVVGVGIDTLNIRDDRHLVVTKTNKEVVDAGLIPPDIDAEAKGIILDLLSNALYPANMSAKVNRLRELFGRGTVVTPEYAVTLKLTNISCSIADGTKVPEGGGLTVNLMAFDGYSLEGANIAVTMGGKDITAEAFNGNAVNIPEVTGNVVISGTAVATGDTVHLVTLTLTGFDSDTDSEVWVNDGDKFETTLTPQYGYKLDGAEVLVDMGGVDIAGDTYHDGKICIDAVTGSVAIEAEAKALSRYSITNNLTGLTSSNTTQQVFEGKSYSAVLYPADGYSLDGAMVTVTMGGVDVTASTYLSGTVQIPAVTGDVVITAVAATTKRHSIAYNMTNVVSTNTIGIVESGSSYETTLTPVTGYTMSSVKVLMAGQDITSGVVNGLTIIIPNVAGDVVIYASATRDGETVATVSVNTTNCTCTIPDGTKCILGDSLVGYLVPDANYSILGAEVLIQMNGQNITDHVYNQDTGEFTISVVTGDIEITANTQTVLS